MDSLDRSRPPQHTPRASYLDPSADQTGPLAGHLLDRVRRTYREAVEIGDPEHESFVIAVGALAVYARACRVPLEELLCELERALIAEPMPEAVGEGDGTFTGARLRATLRVRAEGAVTTNYYQAD
jgi:hypothetical protein